MSEIRYGTVGAGYFGRALGTAVNSLPGARVTSVFDPENGARLAEDLAATNVESVEKLCAADDVDAVIVASPNWAHIDPVLLAAENGKDVFCEKPIALSYSDCARMVDSARDAGVHFMAGHVMNFMSGVRRSKKLIADGIIGDVIFCRAIRNGWEEPQKEITWKKRRSLSGGHLYHHIHELDFVQSIMGPATRATMVGGNVAHSGPEFGDEDDMLVISLEFGNNTYAAIEYGSAFRWPEHYVLIQGTQGAIRIDLQQTGVTVRAGENSESFLLHRNQEEDDQRTEIYNSTSMDGAIMYGKPSLTPPLWLQGIVEEEMTYFHGLMQGNSPTDEFAALSDGSAATATIATADALSRSLTEDRKVDVREIVSEREVAVHRFSPTSAVKH
ncbi:Gfo/Idh/MocA family protein [Paramicrobacterium chengjingii]|uniref:Gfo/Idh/MocA family protein n=1 Tax=Paramicrobacterium chengjingii TaxID=2769067 RepID=UPI00141E942C|nr:Gfo/Idh/MocA family oxidoreductase [Microbacterium chengjingii]